MTIAVLLWPHANARYFESVKTLAASELTVMLRALDENAEVRHCEMNGLPLLTFDVRSLTTE